MPDGWRSWREIVLQWRRKYPVPPPFPKGKFDPTKIRCSPLKCGKCGNTRKVSRHHKGHEFYFAVIAEEFYAARYVRFLAVDIVPLCADCHEKIHEIYAPIMWELKQYVDECLEGLLVDGTPVWRYKPQFKVLESFRKRMVSKCDRWLQRKLKSKKRKRKGPAPPDTKLINQKFSQIKQSSIQRLKDDMKFSD